jgi:Fatty acid hydroxylase superfamily
MIPFFLWSLAGFFLGLVVVSFCEWVLHRYVMHRPLPGLRYPFQAHAVIHHHIFKGDASYHISNAADQEKIPMAWWNGPLLIALISVPNVALAWATGVWALAAGGAVAIAGYYVVYEYLHWCMHLPKARRVEKSWLFQKLNGHHILHHRYMHKNFNVVLPLADLCLGTLLRRSKVRFAQPRGVGVPNVQPRGVALEEAEPGFAADFSPAP